MNPVEALLQNDPASFRDQVHDILMQKLGDRIDLERINVANQLFAEEGDPDEEDVADDDDDSGYDADEQDDFFSDDEED